MATPRPAAEAGRAPPTSARRAAPGLVPCRDRLRRAARGSRATRAASGAPPGCRRRCCCWRVLVVCLAALPRPRPSRAALVAVLLLGRPTASGATVDRCGPTSRAGLGRRQPHAALRARAGALRALAAARRRGRGRAGRLRARRRRRSGSSSCCKVAGRRPGDPVLPRGALRRAGRLRERQRGAVDLGLLPCAILAGRRGVPAPLRGLFLGAAGLLAGAALLGQSRGWLIALPIVGADRDRGGARAAGARSWRWPRSAPALLVALDPLLDVYSDWQRAPAARGALRHARCARCCWRASAWWSWARSRRSLDGRVRVSEGDRPPDQRGRGGGRRRRSSWSGAVGYAVVERSPISAASDEWDEFKQGGSGPQTSQGRLSGGVSTYRYDYWRVAWDEFERAPDAGRGRRQLRPRLPAARARATRRPRYPHSTVLAALAETGLIGGLLLFGAFVAGAGGGAAGAAPAPTWPAPRPAPAC